MRLFTRYLSSFVRVVLLALLLSVAVIAFSQVARAAAASRVGIVTTGASSASALWTDAPESSMHAQGERRIIPEQYRSLFLDVEALHDLLASAPLEFSPQAQLEETVIPLPLPDGGYGRFRFVESPIMEPELVALFPEIKTYLGRGLDDPTARVRFDWTQLGFHAMILSSRSTVYIDPYSWGDTRYYISYYKGDYQYKGALPEEYGPLGDPGAIQELAQQVAAEQRTSGDQLRTYRTAIAATGEYTIFHGGTVPLGQAAIVTALNRVNTVYERDVAVRMVLVANNSLLVYTNPATDPYTNGSGVAMLGENQTNIDAVIGDANYDIGHVFSTGGGGVASLGVPCRTGVKARGVTGRSSPIGDPFYIDYVAHEMGHQYGANHTFNGNTGSCAGNRNASTAYEPGSGTTIMGYAGICGAQDIEPNSDDDFHGASYDEIIAYTQLGSGSTCPVVTGTGNSPPTVNAGIGGFSIPINTPFTLTGSATDPNSDPMTYDWEQFNLGPAGHPDSPVGDAPIFRSFVPAALPSRTFPKMSDIVDNVHTIGELLPSYTRTLTFRLTARDNHVSPSAGGVGSGSLSFDVVASAGPFLVTAPNTALTWFVGVPETVTWNVANTSAAPVSCSLVDIDLSRDGGYTYPVALLANTPNDGSQSVVIPNNPLNLVSTARIRVACSSSIFFDISDVNFTIDSSTLPFVDLNGGVAGINYWAVFTEDAGPVAVVDAANLTVSDPDSAQLDLASATITNLQDGLAESLAASPSGAISAGHISYNAGTGVLTIDPPGTAPLADFQAVLRTVTYNNTSQDPDSLARLIGFLVDDGANTNNPLATTTLSVFNVNDAPSFTKGADVAVAANAGPQMLPAWASAMSPGPAEEAAQAMTFTLTSSYPGLFAAGPSLDTTSGDLSYTTATNIFGAATITATLLDSGGTANGGIDSFAQTFVMTVTEVDVPPVLDPIGAQSVDEELPLSFSAHATDLNQPPQPLTYTLEVGAPAGAAIDSTTGAFSWTPTEAQGPDVYTMTVRVSDSTAPPLSSTETITITVHEVNLAPALAPIADQVVTQGDTLSLTAVGTDSDLPANTLTYTLEAGAPAGVAINPTTGAFTWTPSSAVTPGSYAITVRLTDDGAPALSATVTFNITVESAGGQLYLPLVTR